MSLETQEQQKKVSRKNTFEEMVENLPIFGERQTTQFKKLTEQQKIN
jgi:hypothetical protein